VLIGQAYSPFKYPMQQLENVRTFDYLSGKAAQLKMPGGTSPSRCFGMVTRTPENKKID